MTDLRDLLTLEEAADISGRAAVTLRTAAQHGRLDARKFGMGPRAVWITSREAVAAYIARVATYYASHQPQAQRRPGGHGRRPRRGPAPPG